MGVPTNPRWTVTDDAVVAAAKHGDPEAWRTLHREHAGRLVMWLRTRPTGDTAASPEDVAGEAWAVAAQKIADFTGTTSDFGGWLFGIARRLSATAKRTSDRRATHPGEAPEALEPTDEPHLLVDHNDWICHLLSSLPPRERAAVGLVDGLGVDTATAAEILGTSPVGIRVARHRGLRRLRRLLDSVSTAPASRRAAAAREQCAPTPTPAPGPTPAT